MKLPISERAKVTAATATSDANDTAVITLAATAGEAWCVKGIQFSYDDTPVAGGVTVTAGGSTIFSLGTGAAVYVDVALPCEGLSNHTENSAVVVTLAAGGGTAVGSLNVQYA